jgi:two-component system, chemotaxis family, chemotaxis protein CheY
MLDVPTRTALAVDDSKAIRSMMRRYLEPFGFAVSDASDGVEALAWLDDHPPPVLITLDWNMPRMDGLTFVKELRKRRACWEVRVLMVSAENDPRRVFQVLNYGADAYLVKPVTPALIQEQLVGLGLLAPSPAA